MIDIHCHILPGIDDGSKNWEMTLEMCRLAKQDGISHIVATPHSSPTYTYDRDVNLDLLQELRSRVSDMEFSLGCDFHLTQESLDRLAKKPDHFVIGNSGYVLVEFSEYQTPSQMLSLIAGVQSCGLEAVITHPERNFTIAQSPELPHEFVQVGAFLQITAGSLTGSWGREAKKLSERLLRQDLASFIATDAHDISRRPPLLSKSRQLAAKILTESSASELVDKNPELLISDLKFVKI